MKIAFYALLILFSIIVQTSAFHFLPWLKVYPDIILALAIHGGLRWGRMSGLQFGGLVGFVQDLMLYGSLGINLLSKSLIGYIVGALREKYINDSATARIALVISSTAFDLFVYETLTNALFGYNISILFTRTLITQSLLNLVFVLVALPAITMVEALIERLQERKRNYIIYTHFQK